MVRRNSGWGALLVAVSMCAMLFAFVGTASAVQQNPECLSCHQSMTDWSVFDVDRDTACSKCHTPGLMGTHPRHNAGGNCGSVCHLPNGWGDSSRYAIPGWVGVQGSFAASSSPDAPSSVIHAIHAKPRWMGSVNTPSEKCASCHAVADCSACHDYTKVAPKHLNHSATGNASYAARDPWVGETAHGVIDGSMTIESVVEVENQCATVGCHDVAGMATSAPVQRESHSHDPDESSPVTDTVTYSPTATSWKPLPSTFHTSQKAMRANAAGQTLTTVFPAQVVEVVAALDPYYGQAEVWIDGTKRADIDLYAPVTGYQKVVYRSGALGAGDHTIQIKAKGTKNPLSRATYVVIDGFRAYPTSSTTVAPQCVSCHADKTASHGFNFPHEATGASFASGTYSGFACSDCHGDKLVEEHRRSSSKTNVDTCNQCHTTYAPYLDPTAAGTYDYGCTWTGESGAPGCHQAANTQQPHGFTENDHVPTADAAEYGCRTCHAGELDVIHDDSVATNEFAPNCLSCHGATSYPATKNCTGGCHELTGVDSMESHPYLSAKHLGDSVQAGVGNTGGYSCDTCHYSTLELYPEHNRPSAALGGGGPVLCSSCHNQSYLPRPWGKQCVECHAAGKAPEPHNAFVAKHDYSVYAAANLTSCGGPTCHDVTRVDLVHDASLPGEGDCTSCHVPGAGVPTKKLCTNCHSSHTLTAAHNASAYPASTQCIRCHETASDIRVSHSGGCAKCHNLATGQLTDYLSGVTGINDRYSAECTTCHKATPGASGAAVLGKDYSPADPAHYTGTSVAHTASSQAGTYDYDGAGATYAAYACTACHDMEMKPEHIAKAYTNFLGVPATYPDKCVACHQQRVDGLPGGVWNKTCDQCHATKHTNPNALHNATNVVVTTTGGKTAGVTCAGGSCHNVADIAAIHNNSVTSNDAEPGGVTNCNTCHNPSPVQAQRDCGLVDCHPNYENHVGDHAPAANLECGACHESEDVTIVHALCTDCHANATYPNLTQTNTPVCVDCHNIAEIFAKDYTLPDAHYAGTEATHLSASNGTYNGYQCIQCHKLDMKDEHVKTSVSFVTYESTSTVVGKCVVCHEYKVDPLLTAWDKKCASCHSSTHTARTAKHNASTTNADCGGAGCHAVNDVAAIHNNSVSAVTDADTLKCVVCHANNDSVPAPIDCGAVGCHAGMEHGHGLNRTGSDYNNTTNAGCTNAGPGCHGNDVSVSPDYANAYHPANGCQTGACHTSASQTDPAFNNPQTCQNCHGGRGTAPLNYTGAPDMVPLAAATTATAGGHYDQTIHNLAASDATMSVGGFSEAKCSVCHPAIKVGGLNGLWNQHQVLQVYGNTTCKDCHSFNAQVAAYIKSQPAGDCADCHNLATMGVAYTMHATDSAPPALGVVASTPEFQCGDSGCHEASGLDLHALHKGDGVIIPSFSTTNGVDPYNPARCTTACHPAGQEVGWVGPRCERRLEPQCIDCHDPLMQGWRPWANSCGVNGDCHITLPHAGIGPIHSVTALSQACIDCHETTDMRTNHGYPPVEDCASNNVCHNLEGQPNPSGTGTFTLAGKHECVDCHNAGIMGGRDHAPHDPNHYTGSEATHTATYTQAGNDGGYGRIGSVVATEGFDAAALPVSWTATPTARVTTVAGGYQGTYFARISNAAYFQRTFDTAAIASPTVEFYFRTAGITGGEAASLQASTNGSTFSSVWTTTTIVGSWTKVGPVAVPRSQTLTLRFNLTANASTDRLDVDAFTLKPGDGPDIACAQCHQMELKPEHFKASSEATRVPSIYPDKCVDCHENKADNIAGAWDKSCVTPACHAGNHNASTSKHDATAVSPDCGGSGCHYLKDVAVIHNNSAVGNATVTDCANTCHTSNLNAPATVSCGGTGPGTCHNGMLPHGHELDYDGSLFNATTVTGCTQSGAGCHGTSTTTDYATYHPDTGCISGACHSGNASQPLPEFNNPNTCMNCHGGGPLLYQGATDRIPVTGVSPDGHYPVANHTAVASSRTASMTAGGAASARCNQCHSDAGTGGANGLYPQHQGLPVLGNTSCVDCHNYNLGVTTQISGDWATDTCADCHNATVLPAYVAHNPATAPATTATEAEGAGSCQTTGCHLTLDLHALHRDASGCGVTGCHDYTKQALKPTKKSCGVGGTCHTTDAHNPLAHSIVSDTGTCTRCHEGSGGVAATDVRDVYVSTGFGVNTKAHASCSTCHNAGLNLGATNTTNCVDCHVTGKAGTHAYTPYDPSHYYASSHDSSLTTGANYGTTTYGKTLSDFHGTSLNFERACTTCHTIDLKTEHDKTSVAFNLGGKADKCVACHELKVDNWSTRWSGSCSGEANSCHTLGNLHSDWGTKHNASSQVMSSPGSSFALGSTASVATDNFGTTTTWPTAWTRSSTTYVTAQTGSARSGAAPQIGVNTTRTEYSFYRTTAFNLASYGAGTVQFWYQVNVSDATDFLVCEYSTTSGTTGYTELFRVNADALTWTQSPVLSIPGNGNVWIRFRGTFNATGEYGRVDDLQVNGATSAAYGAALPAGSTAAVSCQNNPNGTECHNVADVANIHSRTPNNGCPICHTSTAQNPTQLNCQASGCHAGINVDNHNTAWHESTIGSNTSGAFSGTGFATGWCRGCHDDSIDNEHSVLSAYGSGPCSVCHKKSSDTAAPVGVTAANTANAIHADTTPGNVLCESCHTSVTPTTPHVQRYGWNGAPKTGAGAIGGVQFGTTWSGHKSFSTMPGSKTSFTAAVDGVAATRSWTLPSVTSMLSNWSPLTESVTMTVSCSDCHGDISGATGPHGGSVTIGMAAGYAKNYSSGVAYSNGSAPYIQPTTAGNVPICAKCHQTTGFNAMNEGHAGSSSHEGSTAGRCINCHVKIPHAWKRPRLLGYTTDPAPYASLRVTSITDKGYTPTSWSKSNCGVSGCGSHSGTATTPLWP